MDICRALLEFETGLISFDEFRLSLTLAILRLKPEKLHASEALHENLFRIAELLDFPYTITEHPDGSRTAAITIRLEQNLLPQAGGVTGYKYVTDAAGIVDTDLTAAQYVEALAILPHVRAALSAGRDADPALDALAQTLYPGASGLSMDEKVAIFYNYRGIMDTIAADPDYDLIFNTQPAKGAPSPVGPQSSILALSKAGFGNIEQIRALDVYTYLAALVQQTVDSIRALAGSGMKIAAFVPVHVMARTFQLSSGQEYNAFKAEVLQAESDHRLPGITDFIFGIDADMIRQRITSVRGPYLFVEYSRVTSTIAAKVDRKDDRFHVALSVAAPQPDNYDLVGSALDQDTTLALISAIRRHMRDDDDPQRGIQWMEFPATLSVWSSKELSNSHGWSMEFDILGVDII